MAQPRRPKGESGPAKSSKHLQKAIDTGLLDDNSRMSALESLLGAAATGTKTSNKKSSTKTKKDQDDDEQQQQQQEQKSPSVTTKAGSKKKSATDLAASSSNAYDDANNTLPISTVSSEDILALLAKIDKTKAQVNDIQQQQTVLRSIATLVSIYSSTATTTTNANSNENSEAMIRSSSTLSTDSSSTTTTTQAKAFTPDAVVAPTVATFCEQLQHHAFHPSVAVRRGLAQCLSNLLSRGSEVRQEVGGAIAKTFAPWLALIGDQVNGEVSRPAKEALEKTFPVGSSKRAQLFSKFGARACKKLLDDLAQFFITGKADFIFHNHHHQNNNNNDNHHNHNLKDSGDSATGIAVGQIFGALTFLASEISNNAAPASKTTTTQQEQPQPQKDPFIQVRSDVCVLMAATLGFALPVSELLEMESEGSTSFIATLSRTASTTFAASANGGDSSSSNNNALLSFSQKKMKNKTRATTGKGEGASASSQPQHDGAAVFGTSASSTYFDPAPTNSMMLPTASATDVTSFLQQQNFFNVIAKKCLPSLDSEAQQQKPVIATSVRLQQTVWSLMMDLIQLVSRSNNNNNNNILSKSAEYIIDFVTNVMTASLFIDDASSSSSSSSSSEKIQNTFAVQQAFWATLISCLHVMCSNNNNTSQQQQPWNPIAINYFSKALRTNFWPSVMDVLDNVAEGDIKILPVPLFDALSSFVLLLQKISASESSFFINNNSDPKSRDLLKSIFDKMIKVANREFETWKKSASASAIIINHNFMNAMRASIEFTGTILHLLLNNNNNTNNNDTSASLVDHCIGNLSSFFSNEKLHSLFNADNLVEEILKLPSSLASSSAKKSTTANTNNSAAKMFLDISDRFAGWSLLAAKNSASPSSTVIIESITKNVAASQNTNKIVNVNLHVQIVRRWINLDNSSDEMNAEATRNLDLLISALNEQAAAFAADTTSKNPLLNLYFHISMWFLREFAQASSLASTTKPALAVRTSLVSQSLFSSLGVNIISSCIKKVSNDSNNNNSSDENFVKTLTRIILLCSNEKSSSVLMAEFANSIIKNSSSADDHQQHSKMNSEIESVAQVLLNNNSSQSSSVAAGILCEKILSTLIKKFPSSITLVNKIIKKLKLHKILHQQQQTTVVNKMQTMLWNWLEVQSQSLSSINTENNTNNNNEIIISSFESVLEMTQSLIQLMNSSSSVDDDDGNNNNNSACLKVLSTLVKSCLVPLASSKNDAFLFVSDEVKEVLQNDDDEDQDEEFDEEENADEEEEDEAEKKPATTTAATFEELRSQFDKRNQVFIKIFDSWASVCDEIPGGSSLIVDLANQLESSLLVGHNDNDDHDSVISFSSGHVPLLAASVRANRFPSQLTSVDTWKHLIENTSSFSLLQLLETESAKRFSIHDFAVAQFPLSNLLDFACEAGVSVSELSNVGRLIVALAESIHATGFKTEIERDYEREQQEEAARNKRKSRDNQDDDDDEEEEEEEIEETDDGDEESDDEEFYKHSSTHQQQSASASSSSLPAPDVSIGTKLILPVMQMLSIRNLWSAKVRESLKFVLSWCLECLLPAKSNTNDQQSPTSPSASSTPFLNSSAVSGLAQSCISICVTYSERAPFLLTGPLALLSQMYTTTKDVRYDRLLRAIYSSVANAWAMDVWRFSPDCFSPWPGSALDSLLWSALMPRGVSLPKEALDKLRRAIAMSPAGAAASMSQEEKNVRAINNGIHAMHLLSLLPENVAHSGAAAPIEVNHVVQAMRSVAMVARPLASTDPEKSRQVFISGLAVFAALSRCIVLSPGALPEVAANAVNCLTQAYKLELLPPAGKFAFQSQSQEASSPVTASSSSSSSEPASSKEENSRKIIQALSALRHGVKAHLYKDDGLTSTMNLCVLDIGCSLGAQLQKYASNSGSNSAADEVDEAQEAEEQRLLLVAYDVSKFLSSDFLSQDDLRALRASAATVDPIARFVIGTHFWLCSRPLKLFSFDEFVGKATTILNLAAQLAVSILIGCRPLIKNQTIMNSFVAVFARSPLRAMNGRQQAVQEVMKLEQQYEAEKAKQLLQGGPETVQPMSDRSKLARVLAIPQKQLSLSAFRRHANFLVNNAKMRVTGISYFVLSFVYLSLSDDPSVSESLSSIAVVQAADLMLCGLNLKDSQSGKLIFECPVEVVASASTNKKKSSRKSTTGRQQQQQQQAANNNNEEDDEIMSQFLQVSKIADPKWLQPAAKSPVVGPAQLRSQFGRWAATCLGLLIQRPVIATLRHWRESLHHTARDALNGFVDTHFSPYLSKMALIDVLAHAPTGDLNTLMERQVSAFHPAEEYGGDKITIEVDRSSRVVTVRFHTDEIETRIAVRVPTGYPLSTAQITDKDIGIKGVSEGKRRSWLLKMSASLLMGSSSLWGVVEMFCTNLAKEFEGVEPCPICYMITSGNELPSMQCKVCKNAKFHKSCLTQWWSTAPQSICPMCRSPWFAV